jgi:hypothetical protein
MARIQNAREEPMLHCHPHGWRIWPLLLIALLHLPGAQAAAMYKFLGRSTIYISGPLRTGDDEVFAGMVDDRVERIVITSTGGNENVAYSMARLIRDKHINVEVSKVCTGVCAHYIFGSVEFQVGCPA